MIDVKEFKSEVHKEYMQWVDEVSDDLEDKYVFTPDEIVSKVVDIVLKKLEV